MNTKFDTPVRHLKSLVHGGLMHVRAALGARSRYGIFPGYAHRAEPGYFDDTGLTDEWQKEVYLHAAELMRAERLRTVYDVGCGSAYKLVHMLGEFETVGFDVPATVEFLRRTYPDRDWRSVLFTERGLERADLVICSDVIEHVPDPDALLSFLEAVAKRDIVVSTPERNVLYRSMTSRYRYGPPSNPTHLREWDAAELAAYLGERFDIVRHEITHHAQATQMIHCRRRSS